MKRGENISALKEFCLGDICVCPERNRLSSPQGERRLEPKIMDVLCCLAEHSRETVPRSTLLSEVWEQRFGGDESLTRAISVLRRTLGDLEPGSDFIETIPKRGYRLRAAANAYATSSSRADLRDESEILTLRLHRGAVAFTAVALLVIVNMSVQYGPTVVGTARAFIAEFSHPDPDHATPSDGSNVGDSKVSPEADAIPIERSHSRPQDTNEPTQPEILDTPSSACSKARLRACL